MRAASRILRPLVRAIVASGIAALPIEARSEPLDPTCAETLARLGGASPEVTADVTGQTTGTVAMLGNLLCFVGDPRCACLRAVVDGGSPERASFLEEVASLLAACAGAEPARSLSGVSQEAALLVCPDERETTVVTLNEVGVLSGFVNEAGSTAANATPLVGDDALDQEIRGIVTFPLDEVPPGAQIDAATLQMIETGTEGDPFALGQVVVDHIDSAGVFDGALFDGYVLESPIGGAASPSILSSGPPLGTKSLAVTEQIRNDVLAGRATSQFRLRLDPGATDGDRSNDDLFFAGGTLEIVLRALP